MGVFNNLACSISMQNSLQSIAPCLCRGKLDWIAMTIPLLKQRKSQAHETGARRDQCTVTLPDAPLLTIDDQPTLTGAHEIELLAEAVVMLGCRATHRAVATLVDEE